jgi:hypothetical protein
LRPGGLQTDCHDRKRHSTPHDGSPELLNLDR